MKINDWKILKSEFGTSSKRYTSTPKKITYWQKCCYLNCKLKNENKLFALTKEASPILQSDINILMCEMDYSPPPLLEKLIISYTICHQLFRYFLCIFCKYLYKRAVYLVAVVQHHPQPNIEFVDLWCSTN